VKKEDDLGYVGAKIRRIRQKNFWSQKELASLLGCHKAQISKYETGATEMNYYRLCIFAQKFNVDLNDLLGVNGDISCE